MAQRAARPHPQGALGPPGGAGKRRQLPGRCGTLRRGAGLQAHDLITVSTGIGAGLILDDELYAGTSGAAGEVGHLVGGGGRARVWRGPRGMPGGLCVGHGDREPRAEDSSRRACCRGQRASPNTTRRWTAEDVFGAGEEGEAEASAIIERAGRYLGIGLASLINTLNPQAIVLGGGVINMGEKIMGRQLIRHGNDPLAIVFRRADHRGQAGGEGRGARRHRGREEGRCGGAALRLSGLAADTPGRGGERLRWSSGALRIRAGWGGRGGVV